MCGRRRKCSTTNNCARSSKVYKLNWRLGSKLNILLRFNTILNTWALVVISGRNVKSASWKRALVYIAAYVCLTFDEFRCIPYFSNMTGVMVPLVFSRGAFLLYNFWKKNWNRWKHIRRWTREVTFAPFQRDSSQVVYPNNKRPCFFFTCATGFAPNSFGIFPVLLHCYKTLICKCDFPCKVICYFWARRQTPVK